MNLRPNPLAHAIGLVIRAMKIQVAMQRGANGTA